MIPTLEWTPAGVNFLDQTKLPHEETYVLATTYDEVATDIRDMIVRGAMAIGVSAAMGVALGIDRSTATDIPTLNKEVALICSTLAATRPTAVNLFWGIAQVRDLYNSLAAANTPIPEIKKQVVALAQHLYDEDIANLRILGAYGAALLPDSGTVLTHCNAGALAARGYGSALGVIRAAIEAGKARSTSSPTRLDPSTRAHASPRGSSSRTTSPPRSSATTWPATSWARAA